ncbi:MAG: CehA/McbA family metallohydrolase domain-containing protein [Planctomycetota bacterium]|jgi:hypothetical protein
MHTKRFCISPFPFSNCRSSQLSPVSTLAAVSLLLVSLMLTGCARVTESQRWWKGNLHTHTLWSDGRDYPEMVVEWYKKHGYHFLALSDHNILSQGPRWIDAEDNRAGEEALRKYRERFGDTWVEHRTVDGTPQVRLKPLSEFRCLREEPDRFLLIQAEEITQKKAHINAINLQEVIPRQEGDSAVEVMRGCVNAVLAQRRQTGRMMFAQINHPNFRWALTAEDIMQIEDAKFLEVANCHAAVRNSGDERRAGTERMWDIILTKRLAELDLPVVYGTATDDAHHYHEYGPKQANPGRGWVTVRAVHLTPESLIKAMEAGDFYASTGVVLKNVRFDGQTLKVVIKPEIAVSYITQFIGTLKGYDPAGKPVLDANGVEIQTTRIYSDDIGRVLAEVKGTVAGYTLTGNEIYVRARVTSTKSMDNPFQAGDVEVAWVQPVVPSKN